MIDDALELYLIDLAERVIVNFYKLARMVVEILREWLNEMGWNKLANYKRIETGDDELGTFTKVKSPSCIPEFLNDFITVYLPMKYNFINKNVAINLSEHLCKWLYNRNLTPFKISKND